MCSELVKAASLDVVEAAMCRNGRRGCYGLRVREGDYEREREIISKTSTFTNYYFFILFFLRLSLQETILRSSLEETILPFFFLNF